MTRRQHGKRGGVASRFRTAARAALLTGTCMVAFYARAAEDKAPAAGAPDPQELRKLLAAFSAPSATADERVAIVRRVLEMGPPGPEQLEAAIGQRLVLVRSLYERDFRNAAVAAQHRKIEKAGEAAGKSRTQMLTVIKELRSDVLDLRDKQGLTTGEIRQAADPAVQELEALLVVSPKDVLGGDEKLTARRAEVVELGGLKAKCRAARGGDGKTGASATPPADVTEAFEKLAVAMALTPSLVHRRTFQGNVLLADQIQPKEAECIFQVNCLRALLGLRVLRTDVRLCTAARDHSTDMKTKGFYGHISPVPGKRKFSDRAKLAGTTACGENICYGWQTAAGANREWFLSPAHFKVMLHDIHRRIGVGHVHPLWTQMFGY